MKKQNNNLCSSKCPRDKESGLVEPAERLSTLTPQDAKKYESESNSGPFCTCLCFFLRRAAWDRECLPEPLPVPEECAAAVWALECSLPLPEPAVQGGGGDCGGAHSVGLRFH